MVRVVGVERFALVLLICAGLGHVQQATRRRKKTHAQAKHEQFILFFSKKPIDLTTNPKIVYFPRTPHDDNFVV